MGFNSGFKGLMIYTPQQILFRWPKQEEWDGRGM